MVEVCQVNAHIADNKTGFTQILLLPVHNQILRFIFTTTGKTENLHCLPAYCAIYIPFIIYINVLILGKNYTLPQLERKLKC